MCVTLDATQAALKNREMLWFLSIKGLLKHIKDGFFLMVHNHNCVEMLEFQKIILVIINITIVIIYQAKCPYLLWFQYLQCEDMQISLFDCKNSHHNFTIFDMAEGSVMRKKIIAAPNYSIKKNWFNSQRQILYYNGYNDLHKVKLVSLWLKYLWPG